jgi:hypothetical protein
MHDEFFDTPFYNTGGNNRDLFETVLIWEFGDEPTSTYLDECNTDRFLKVCSFVNAVTAEDIDLIPEMCDEIVEMYRTEFLKTIGGTK